MRCWIWSSKKQRVSSRVFLEPACGTGNFLVEILNRKLAVVAERYARSQFEYERYAVLAISSIYGIDILLDNVTACQHDFLIFLISNIHIYLRKRLKSNVAMRLNLFCGAIFYTVMH